MEGVYNAAAPEYITNKEFMQTLAKVVNRPICFPNIPSIAMKILLGEMSTILIYGSRVSPEKILSLGYQFKFLKLEQALKNLLSK